MYDRATALNPLSLHDALPICRPQTNDKRTRRRPVSAAASQSISAYANDPYADTGEGVHGAVVHHVRGSRLTAAQHETSKASDRKSTRLNSSHRTISYALFRLK